MSVNFNIKVLGKATKADSILQLVKIRFPLIGRSKRNKLLDKLVKERGADYFIEVWDKGGIMMKPRTEFFGIFVYKNWTDLPEEDD